MHFKSVPKPSFTGIQNLLPLMATAALLVVQQMWVLIVPEPVVTCPEQVSSYLFLWYSETVTSLSGPQYRIIAWESIRTLLVMHCHQFH